MRLDIGHENMTFKNGFKVIDNFLSDSEIELVAFELDKLPLSKRVGGVRNIEKKSQVLSRFIESEKIQMLAAQFLADEPKLVRAIYFNKTPEQNWLVAWHQDKTVVVSKKFCVQDWETWSIKDDAIHVQPPLSVLNQMVTIRLHLDQSNEENGCLKIIPNSHKSGILTNDEIKQCVKSNDEHVCAVNKGTALVMRPHILHASSKGVLPSQRRVLHLEFSCYQLPHGVQWG